MLSSLCVRVVSISALAVGRASKSIGGHLQGSGLGNLMRSLKAKGCLASIFSLLVL